MAVVIVEFWLAGRLGEAWLAVRKGLVPSLGELPGECVLIGRGQQLPAGRLLGAQRFAARVWSRVAMAVVVLLFPVIGISAAVRPGRAGTDIGVGLIWLIGCACFFAVLQMGVLSFRAGLVWRDVLKAGRQAAEQPLPPGSPGLPSRWDFWVTLILGLAVFGLLLYAGAR